MSAETAIRVENLCKRYRYGGIAPLSDSLRTDLSGWAKGLLRLRGEKRPPGSAHHESFRAVQAHRLDVDPNYFWALRDVNLEIKRGEIVGIIGRNGSGKSTMLKILSRITPPTTGTITYHGRVASLLEVGTGFHRELTGRENVFLNGSILGMKRAEITRRFDEIVAFAEVDKFIDTPVKFYSSGMYVRLAFAVAAHLQPDILIVDEVLAVGDASFQKKCLGKMDEVAKQGRTVLFVSHSMPAIETLCTRTALLEEGRMVLDGSPKEATNKYLAGGKVVTGQSLVDRLDRLGNGKLRFTEVQFLNKYGKPVSEITSGDELTICAHYKTTGPIDPERIITTLSFRDRYKNPVALFASDEMGTRFHPFGKNGTLRVKIPQLLLRGGDYSLHLQASHLTTAPENVFDLIEDAAALHVRPSDYWKSGRTNRGGAFCIIDALITNN